MTVITLTAGTMFLMWLGDQITDRGVGNGMSMIISVGIVARLPAALIQAWRTFVPARRAQASQVNPLVLVLMIAFLVSSSRRSSA
jgi:preprotein translocase subunit SecY